MTQAQNAKIPNNENARANMVFSLLRSCGVRDERILALMETLPREMFVPPHARETAYIDKDIKITDSRHLMKPLIMARMMQAVEICPADRVLDIAPATGYSTVLLATLARQVVALESDPEMAEILQQNLGALKIGNVQVFSSPLISGRDGSAPYDVIFINGAVGAVPEAILDQLTEGGRLITVVGINPGDVRIYRKIYGEIQGISLFDANIQPLTEFASAAKIAS